MIQGDSVLNAFIDANILFVVAFALWSAARFCLHRLGLKHAYSTELKLLNGVFLAIVFSPFIVVAIRALQNAGIADDVTVNFSDMLVSYYLNGGFHMKATEFEKLLLLRETFTQNVNHVAGWGGKAVVGVFVAGLLVMSRINEQRGIDAAQGT